ncbi:MAG: tRNA dihydrouridine synthase DusB [Nitrospirota bacterium]
MKIGNVEITGKAVLAPLAGITDMPFRMICKEQGAALVYTEMISAEGLIRNQKGTDEITESCPGERPVAFQLFGRKPASMARAARLLAEKGADIIDINMGCPVKKVTKGGAGSALLKDISEAAAVIRAVVEASRVPVTVKMRTGINLDKFVAVELAQAAEAAGSSAVAVHGRSAGQGFGGKADWSKIAAVKAAVKIPVIGNGDIVSANDARRMLDETGCDLVMVGRGALGNPWIFSEINALLEHGELPPPEPKVRGETLLRHLRAVTGRIGESAGVKVMRKHGAWYSKGLVGSPEFRRVINHAGTIAEFEDAVQKFFSVSL